MKIVPVEQAEPDGSVHVIHDPAASVSDVERDSAATKLIRLGEECELFHDSTREAYATAAVNGQHQTMRTGSKLFREFLSLEFFKREKKAPSPQALASALLTIEAKGIFEGSQKEVHTRVAEDNGNIYLDLCNDRWEVVRLTKEGWEVIQGPPVKFVRRAAMRALPKPSRGGSPRYIEKFMTVTGDALTLVKGYLLGCLRERGPFPILVLKGEQGTGKTTLCKLLKRTIDPSKAAMRCLPKDERDLMIAAEGQWILALDNLSHIDEQMSDALCRLATGGGLSTRTLYTDYDETIFESERPVILNAIADVLSRSDLIDRSIVLTVPPLEESKRRKEFEFWQDFEKSHPLILGWLCDAACMALADTGEVPIPAVRMADFCMFASRGERALGLKGEQFLSAYERNREDVNEVMVDLSPVAQAMRQFVESRASWSGTAAELLRALTNEVAEDCRRSREWPKTPRGLSGTIRRLIPNLRPFGITIKDLPREAGTGRRLIEIKSSDKTLSQPSRSGKTVTTEPIENERDTCRRDGCDTNLPSAAVDEDALELTTTAGADPTLKTEEGDL